MGISAASRVLVCLPHPDDEAVFISGFLYKLSLSKILTRLLVFTKGEKSTLRYGLSPLDNLAQAREKELAKSLAILGIKDYKVYDFGDGQLENRETEVLTALEQEIRLFQPSHLVTLEPDGVYGHPDHIALSCFVSKYQSQVRKVLYVTVTPNYILPPSASKMAKKSGIKPIAPEYKLKLGLPGFVHKIKSLKVHKSQFRFSLIHNRNILFFLRNNMLGAEYFAYKR